MESRYTWKNQLLLGLRNFAVVTGIVLLLLYLIVISGDAARRELEELFVEERRTVTRIDEPVVYGYENGAKVWELRSQVAETEKETESSELERIYELILFKGGEENIIIRGDFGNWDKPREKLTLSGNVVVESADGTTFLYTESLTWEERNKVLSCPNDVDFTVERNRFLANSLYSDDDLVTIDFVGNVIMFVVGLESESFVTREGEFPVEDIDSRPDNEGMNVLAEYVHYDKSERLCFCFPYIPVSVRTEHGLDEFGIPIPETLDYVGNTTELLSNPEYIAALQRSVAEMDLSPEEQAFLRGETDTVGDEPVRMFDAPGSLPDWLSRNLPETGVSAEGGEETAPAGPVSRFPGAQVGPPPGAPPMMGGRTPPMGGSPSELQILGEPQTPGTTGPVSHAEPTPLNVPTIPPTDPEIVMTVADYSRITDWDISPNLAAELFEGDEGFVPMYQKRDGQVFCYRNNRKFWCEELNIDLGDHRLEALRHVDARFRNLRDPSREPPESRAGQAIQESPTQIICNYMIHNWEVKVTEGFGRVLMIQPEKDVEADNIVYYEEADVTQAWGNVIVRQYGGVWWVTSGAIEDVQDERAREDIRNPSVITTDALLTYARNVSWAFGDVVFRQEKQTMSSERAQYEENNDILVMAGEVRYENDDGERLSSALLTMDLKLEEYIAEGGVVARNIAPEEYQENLAEHRENEPGPEDDARARLLSNRTAIGLGNWSFAINNPPPEPIEVLEGARSNLDTTEVLGPEVPLPPIIPPGFDTVGPGMYFGPSEESAPGQTSTPPEPVLMETNEFAELPPSVAGDEGVTVAPTGDETIAVDQTGETTTGEDN